MRCCPQTEDCLLCITSAARDCDNKSFAALTSEQK